MNIAGHVSRAMLPRYSHVRMEAKRRALDEIAARQRAADKKRREEIRQQRQTGATSKPVLVQQSAPKIRWDVGSPEFREAWK
jgi:hypothetical protein